MPPGPTRAFGDIWCLFVSVGPAPHIYQRGERVREPVCTIHGHYRAEAVDMGYFLAAHFLAAHFTVAYKVR